MSDASRGDGYRVEIAVTARRDLHAVPPRIVPAIIAFVYGDLARSPRTVGKPLQRELEGLWGARRGPYRTVYEILDDRLIVLVIHVAHRADVYRPRNDRIQAALDADPALAGHVRAGLAKMDAEDRTDAMSLATVRQAADLTQVELAQRLGAGQGAVSRIEHSDNLLVSTLLSYLDAAGVQDVTLTATVAGRQVDIDLAEMARH